jgi:hypothetical protein
MRKRVARNQATAIAKKLDKRFRWQMETLVGSFHEKRRIQDKHPEVNCGARGQCSARAAGRSQPSDLMRATTREQTMLKTALTAAAVAAGLLSPAAALEAGDLDDSLKSGSGINILHKVPGCSILDDARRATDE